MESRAVMGAEIRDSTKGILEGLQALILGEHLTEPLEGQGA